MKAHLLTTEEPIFSGHNRKADCGKEIPEAQILFSWDGLEMGNIVLDSTRFCKDCMSEKSEGEGARYLYGIRPRVEKKGE